jgi:hypothetical protein
MCTTRLRDHDFQISYGPADDYTISTPRPSRPTSATTAVLLVTGDPSNSAVRFRMGGIVCLEGTGDDWAVKWIVTPELVV